jgi:hypothetical protein
MTKLSYDAVSSQPFLSRLSDNTIQAIRDATNRACALGDESFIEQVANTLPRRPCHYHKVVIGDPKRLIHQKLSNFYFSTNLTPKVCFEF